MSCITPLSQVSQLFEPGIHLAIMIILQLLGVFLIVTSAAMFAQDNMPLHRSDKLLLINILVAGTGFLLVDWFLLLPSALSCDIYTYMFIVLGSVGTFTSTGIAINRYRTMVRMSNITIRKKHAATLLVCIWLLSLCIILYPICKKIAASIGGSIEQDHVGPAQARPTICMFGNSLLYEHPVTGIAVAFLLTFAPICVTMFCYFRIYIYIREARISRWMNAAVVNRGHNAHVIECKGRKANVFEIPSVSQTPRPSESASLRSTSREQSIFKKGIVSVSIITFTWVPFSSMIVFISFVGFHPSYVIYLKYLGLLTKFGVILDVLFYICFNERYNKAYIKLVTRPFRKLLDTENGSVMVQENASNLGSQIHFLCTDTPMVYPSGNTTTFLPPIREHPNHALEIQGQEETTTGETSSKKPREPAACTQSLFRGRAKSFKSSSKERLKSFCKRLRQSRSMPLLQRHFRNRVDVV